MAEVPKGDRTCSISNACEGSGKHCEMASGVENPVRRGGYRPLFDLRGAAIQANSDDRDPSILLPYQANDIPRVALDIGGSLIKVVYFSRHEEQLSDDKKREIKQRLEISNGHRTSYHILGGRLHFVKFETRKLNECIDFISLKQLHCEGADSFFCQSGKQSADNTIIKATGGGAYKFADVFKERLGINLDKIDEIDCLVAGANFLLKTIQHEAFTHMEGQKEFVEIDQNDLFPYLLVNIGSGVGMIKVDGDGQFERVGGTSLGGGTYWGLGRLLTKNASFDELLELSQQGNNRNVDMLVGDIYGGNDYSKIGLSASTIASSFGKAISEAKDLSEYAANDLSFSLLRMISNNIGQIAYLYALVYGLKRIFFGGFFICGHAFTMDTISTAVNFWSKGQMKAMFLQHEGFLGALGAFMSYETHGADDLMAHQLIERCPMRHPYLIGQNNVSLSELHDKVTWAEKVVEKDAEVASLVSVAISGEKVVGGLEQTSSKNAMSHSDTCADLDIGLLHLVPTLDAAYELDRCEPNSS